LPLEFKTPALDDLAKEMFFKFARIEYAFKASGFYKKRQKKAEPDWDSFAKSIRGKLGRNEKAMAAAKYLIGNPPLQQIIKDGKLDWERVNHDPNNTQEILLCVRRAAVAEDFPIKKYRPTLARHLRRLEPLFHKI
jgi:hypothetical protein